MDSEKKFKNLIHLISGLFACLVMALILLTAPASAAEKKKPKLTLITNVNIFDGFSDKLAKGMSVLVEGNHIKEVGKSIKGACASVIDGGGLTMTPGLIDMHTHSMFYTSEGSNSYQDEWDAPAGGAMAAQGLRDDALMKGITTVREIAGNSRGRARAGQRGLRGGPRS